VLIAVCCCGVVSHSQTADELIAKNIQARGGMEKMKAIKTLRMTGRFEGGGGFTASVGQENERPNLIRQIFTLQGMTAVQAYDGATGWQIQPFGGHKDPELIGEVLKVIGELAIKGRTSIIVTHELAFARDIASKIVFMDGGQIVEEGPPNRLLTSPKLDRTRAFIARIL